MRVQTCPRKGWIFLVVFSVPLLPVSYSSVEQNRGAKAMESCKFIDLLKNRLKTTIRLCCTLPYSSLHCSNLLYATLLYFTLCYATLLDSLLHYATPLYFYSSLPYSTVLYSTLVYSMLCCTTLRYSMLLYPTLLYSTPLYIAISFSSNKHVQSYWFFFIWLSLQPSFHHVSIRLHTGWVVLTCLKNLDITSLSWFSFCKHYLELLMR